MQFQVNERMLICLETKAESICNGSRETFLNSWYKITFKVTQRLVFMQVQDSKSHC